MSRLAMTSIALRAALGMARPVHKGGRNVRNKPRAGCRSDTRDASRATSVPLSVYRVSLESNRTSFATRSLPFPSCREWMARFFSAWEALRNPCTTLRRVARSAFQLVTAW